MPCLDHLDPPHLPAAHCTTVALGKQWDCLSLPPIYSIIGTEVLCDYTSNQ